MQRTDQTTNRINRFHRPAGPVLVIGLLAGSLLAGAGCTTHRIETKHEVKPIHITVDVNLKIDRALDDYFDDIDDTETKKVPATVQPEEG